MFEGVLDKSLQKAGGVCRAWETSTGSCGPPPFSAMRGIQTLKTTATRALQPNCKKTLLLCFGVVLWVRVYEISLVRDEKFDFFDFGVGVPPKFLKFS